MRMLPKSLQALAFSLALLLTITACNPTSTKPFPDAPEIVTSEEDAPSAAMQGRYAQEAMNLMKQAKDANSPLREQLYMKAAEYLLLSNRTALAIQASQQVDPTTLSEFDGFRYQLLSAEIDIKRNAHDRAISTLVQQTPPEGVEKEQLLRFHTDKAVAYHQMGKMLESARARTKLDTLIDNPDLKTRNQLKIIKSLSTLSDTALDLLQPNPPDVLNGWMELARIFKQHGEDFLSARPQFETWKSRFPNHPAGSHLYARHYGNVQAQFKKLAMIAVLLPETGPLQKWAAAIRKGIKAAHMAQPKANRPQLRFYDSCNPEDIPTLYQRAHSEGANAIIGPLNKTAVTVLATGGNLPVPTLALNQVQMTMSSPTNLFQFSLSPENEARQAAERALNDGHTQAIAMIPEGAWGTRVLNAFNEHMTALGGRVSEHQVYDSKLHDFSDQIKTLLNLDESAARKKRLQRTIGRKLKFKPSRRKDADFIFLAANTVLARQIRPQLQFHHAGDMAIYSTSRVFSGNINPSADQDLNGIRFPEAPWLLNKDSGPLSRQAVAQLFPASQRQYPRLYAMGIDSYNLLPQLERLNNGKLNETTEGKTGKLYMDQFGLIHRQMLWAEIANGKPNIIGYAPRAKLNRQRELPRSFSTPTTTPAFDL